MSAKPHHNRKTANACIKIRKNPCKTLPYIPATGRMHDAEHAPVLRGGGLRPLRGLRQRHQLLVLRGAGVRSPGDLEGVPPRDGPQVRLQPSAEGGRALLAFREGFAVYGSGRHAGEFRESCRVFFVLCVFRPPPKRWWGWGWR